MAARPLPTCLFALGVLLGICAHAHAATKWVEARSPHFTVFSDAGERQARGVAWQFEQIRETLVRLWPWATFEFGRPVVVYAARDETSMRALVPKYFEGRGAFRPTSVFQSAPHGHFVVLRTDTTGRGQPDVNPYMSSYWSYVSLVLGASIPQELPPWFARGLAEVFSNTIVRENQVLVGSLIPWHLRALRERGRPTVEAMLAADQSSPLLANADRMAIFDATAWALVHYLIFGNQGKNIPVFNEFAEAVRGGASPNDALAKTYGSVTAVREGLAVYIDQSLYVYQRYDTAVAIKAASFPVRDVSPAEAAVAAARLHAATDRPVEARAQLALAAGAPAAAEVEGILLERERKPDEARSAYARASEAGAGSFYGEYRLASLSWPRGDAASPEAFATIEKHLRRSVELNPTYGPAYALLADALVRLNRHTEALGAAQRAVTLDPRDGDHHLSVARALWGLSKRDEATTAAKKALAMAGTEAEQKNAKQMLDFLANAPAPAAPRPAAEGSRATRPGLAAEEGQQLFAACNSGGDEACRKLQGVVDVECARGDRQACMMGAFFYAEGRGVAKDEDKAIAILQPLCDGGMAAACVPIGSILVQRGGTANRARGRELLDKSCKAGEEQACTLLRALK